MNYTVYSLFQFFIFICFTNQITLHQSLAQKLNLIFKVSQTKKQIDIPLWAHMGHKEWKMDGKTFTRCYTIASKFWDEFNSNFVLLHFSSCRSMKIGHLYFKNLEKKAVRQCIKTPKHCQCQETSCVGTCPCNFLSIPNLIK